jgi:hypothetical protein
MMATRLCVYLTRKTAVKMRLSLKVLNEKTGELENKEFQESRRRKTLERDFCHMKLESLEQVLKAPLKPSDLRVLLALVSMCEWANVVRCKRKALMSTAGITEEQCCVSLKRLADQGFLVRDPEEANYFELLPSLCWRGAPADWAAATAGYYQKVPAEVMQLHRASELLDSLETV